MTRTTPIRSCVRPEADRPIEPRPPWKLTIVCVVVAALIGLYMLAVAPARAQGTHDACDLDFNNSGVVTPEDMDAFLRCYSDGPCAIFPDGTPDHSAPPCDTIDFNHDGSFFDPQDIDAFVLAFEGGPCPNGFYPVPRFADASWVYLRSDGDDANTGLSKTQAVKTQLRAYLIIQGARLSGRPAALILSRGDTITEPLTGEYGAFDWGGTPGQPMYIAADPDDDPALPRPVVRPLGGGNGFFSRFGNTRVVSIEFVGAGTGDGVRFHVDGSVSPGNIVISDVLTRGFNGGIAVQGQRKTFPIRNVLVSRCATKWSYNLLAPKAQGAFASCVDGMTWDSVVFLQNGYNFELGDPEDTESHNLYSVSNNENVRLINCVSVEASATGAQCRGGRQDISKSVFLNNPLGVTFGHVQAELDDEAAGSLMDSLVLGGGSIGELPRSFSIGLNRCGDRGGPGVVVARNIIWREPPEGDAMDHGAAFWLQGSSSQQWIIVDNDIYDPRLPTSPPTASNSAPLYRDDRVAGSTPSADLIATQNRLYREIQPDWTPPSLVDYLGLYNVSVFDPSFAARTFGELASRNRRGDWKPQWEAKALIAWWRTNMRPAE